MPTTFQTLNTSKSLSEALIFASTNPQYDDRLFIELQVQYMKIPSSNLGTTCCVQKLFLIFRTFLCTSSPPCSAKRRASEKDLPVSEDWGLWRQRNNLKSLKWCSWTWWFLLCCLKWNRVKSQKDKTKIKMHHCIGLCNSAQRLCYRNVLCGDTRNLPINDRDLSGFRKLGGEGAKIPIFSSGSCTPFL